MRYLFSFLIILLFGTSPRAQPNEDPVTASRDSQLMDSLYQLSIRYYASAPDSGRFYARQLVEAADQANLPVQAAKGLRVLGIMSQIQGNLDSSLVYYDAALEKIRETPAPALRAGLYNSIGITFEELEQYDKSRVNLRRAITAYGSTEPRSWLGNITLNIGNGFLNEQRLDSSLHYYNETRKFLLMANPPDTTVLIAVTYQEGKVYHDLKQYERSSEKLQEALKLARATGNKNTIMTILNGLTETYLRLGKLGLTKPLIEEHEQLAVDIESLAGQYTNKIMRYKLDTLSNRWRSAIHHYLKAVVLHDSLKGKQMQEKVAELENSFENREKLRNINALTLENQAITERNRTQQRHSIMLCVIVGLLGCIALLLWSRYRATERERMIVARKSEDKTLLLQEIHHRAKNNLATIEGLLNLQLEEITTGDAIVALNRSRERIQAIGLIHEQLTYSESAGNISANTYLNDLTGRLRDKDKEVEMHVTVPNVLLDLSLAVPLGLVVNEAVSNSMEHAVAPELDRKVITVEVKYDSLEEYLDLVVADNGMNATPPPPEKSFGGLSLIRGLIAQLNGTVDIIFSGNTTLRARIPYAAINNNLA